MVIFFFKKKILSTTKVNNSQDMHHPLHKNTGIVSDDIDVLYAIQKKLTSIDI